MDGQIRQLTLPRSQHPPFHESHKDHISNTSYAGSGDHLRTWTHFGQIPKKLSCINTSYILAICGSGQPSRTVSYWQDPPLHRKGRISSPEPFPSTRSQIVVEVLTTSVHSTQVRSGVSGVQDYTTLLQRPSNRSSLAYTMLIFSAGVHHTL